MILHCNAMLGHGQPGLLRWYDWCFMPWFCTVRLILGRGQPGLWRRILLRIMLQVQDESVNLLTSSAAHDHCTMNNPLTAQVLMTVLEWVHENVLLEQVRSCFMLHPILFFQITYVQNRANTSNRPIIDQSSILLPGMWDALSKYWNGAISFLFLGQHTIDTYRQHTSIQRDKWIVFYPTILHCKPTVSPVGQGQLV